MPPLVKDSTQMGAAGHGWPLCHLAPKGLAASKWALSIALRAMTADGSSGQVCLRRLENDFGRYSIGSTTDGLQTDPDGSITILTQHDRPENTANWLPAPASGPFNLTMRMY